VAVKLLPGLAAPRLLSGLLPPGGVRTGGVLAGRGLAALVSAGTAVVVFVLVYLPYLATDGRGVLGYLPGYLHEEGYDDARIQRFALLRLVLPDVAAQAGAGLVILAAVVTVLRHGDPARPWRGALLVTGAAFLALCPAYPWYALLLIALVALDGRWEWLGLPLAATAVYLAHAEQGVQLAGYGAALVVVLAGAVLRARGARRSVVAVAE
jgi:hypothetical protein